MKYSGMVCWVQPRERKELIDAINGTFSVEFAESCDGFLEKAKGDKYLVISMKRARQNINAVRELLKSLDQNLNVLLDCNGKLYCDVIDAFTDAGKRYHHYTLVQIIENVMRNDLSAEIEKKN